MTTEAETRDDLIKRVKRLVVELEDVVDEIDSARARAPKFWTEFDHRRTTIDMRLGARIITDTIEKLMQVGRWDEIMKPGQTWANVKKKIK